MRFFQNFKLLDPIWVKMPFVLQNHEPSNRTVLYCLRLLFLVRFTLNLIVTFLYANRAIYQQNSPDSPLLPPAYKKLAPNTTACYVATLFEIVLKGKS